MPRSRLSCMRFCVVHELRVACFKQLFATLRPFVQGFPNLSTKSKLEKGIRGEIDNGVRVLSQDDPRLFESPKEVDIDELIDPVHFASSEGQFGDDAPATVRMLDDSLLTMADTTAPYQAEKKSYTSSEDLPTLPLLPSPLLCPRRAFLASLILASKFMQDKCYSNRAWAKLAGLPAREIAPLRARFGRGPWMETLGWQDASVLRAVAQPKCRRHLSG